MNNRNPILSFFLSIIFSGLGQIYNGELKKGIFCSILILPIFLLLCYTDLLATFKGMLFIKTIFILFKLVVAIEAYHQSKLLNPYQLKPINKIWIYLLYTFLFYSINSICFEAIKTWIGYGTFEIKSTSMEPTIKVNDKIMSTKSNPKNIEQGDIIEFTQENGEHFVARIIGLPGDKIEIKNDIAIINQVPEKWELKKIETENKLKYQIFNCTLPNGKAIETLKEISFDDIEIPIKHFSNMEPIIVDKEKVFVLADSRSNSMDSRIYGQIPIKNVNRKINYIWLCSDLKRIGLKLD